MTAGTFSEGDGAAVGHALRRREAAVQPHGRGLRRLLEYTDAQVGRIVDYLEESGQLDNTIIFYCADNGASGEGTPNGSVNENKFFNAGRTTSRRTWRCSTSSAGRTTYNHYPTGWAVAFSTPFRMFKRYSYQGGVCDPLVIHWPKGIKARGEVRHQYHHCTDIVPTILECCGVEMPEVVDGVEQSPLAGRLDGATRSTTATAPTRKETQYYEMLGTRGIWHKGWKAVTEHGPVIGLGNFDKDRWQLFHTDEDRSEAHDLAEQHPDKVKELKTCGWRRPRSNNVLPLNDLTSHEFRELEFTGRRCRRAASTRTTRARPRCRRRSAANTHGVSFKILAEVEFDRRLAGRDLRPGLALRRPLAVRQGRQARLRLQLPRHPARAAALGAGADAPAGTSSGSSSPRSAWASTASRIGT